MPISDLFGKTPETAKLQLLGQGWVKHPGGFRMAVLNLVEQIDGIPAREWAAADEQLVHDHAKAPDVAPAI